MAIRKIPADTSTFHFFNANPKDRRTCDCVIRAICVALSNTWQDTLAGLTEIAVKTCDVTSAPTTYGKYLKKMGYEKQKSPRKEDGTKYTVREFCEEIATSDNNYVVSVAQHLVCIRNKRAWDTWNSTGKCVGNYWIIPDSESNPYDEIVRL